MIAVKLPERVSDLATPSCVLYVDRMCTAAGIPGSQ